MRLSHGDFDLLQKAVLELHEYRDVGEFVGAAARVLLHVIPADNFAVTDFTIESSARMIFAWDSVGRLSEPGVVAGLVRVGNDHPLTQYVVKTGDPSALKFSDFFTVRQFRNTELYADGSKTALPPR